LDTDEGAGFESGEAEACDDAVFADEGDDVGDDAEGGEGEEVEEEFACVGGDARGACGEGAEAPGELVGDGGAREIAEGVGGVWAARVDDGVGGGEIVDGGWGVVVIGDDEVDAGLSGGEGGLDGGDAAVDGDDDFGALGGERAEGVGVEAVAFVESVWDVGGDVGVRDEVIEGVEEDGGGGDAVNVVVAVDDDGLALASGVEEACGGAVHVGHGGGVVEVEEGGLEEVLGDVRGECAGVEDAGEERCVLEAGGGGCGRGTGDPAFEEASDAGC